MAEFDPIAFNMENPERHLLDYLPPFLQQVQEFQAVNAANEPEIKAAWRSLERVLGNQFLAKADSGGLTVWERELGIFAKDTDTLALRRARIKAAWQRQPPYTMRWLRGWLDSLCGEDNYSLNVQDYLINILLEYERLSEPNALLREIVEVLAPVRPANMLLETAMTAKPVIFQTLEQFQPISLKMSFYFSNQPNDVILLNGRRRLDGSWKLNSTFRGVIMRSFGLHISWLEQQKMHSEKLFMPGIALANRNCGGWPGVSLTGRFCNSSRVESKSLGLNSSFAERGGSMAGENFVKDTMWQLNGAFKLDSSKKLNAAIIEEEI